MCLFLVFFINLIMIFHTVNDFLKVWTIVYTQFDRKLVTAFTGKAINNCVSSTLNCLQWSQIKESHGWRCFRTCNIDTYSVHVPLRPCTTWYYIFMHKKKVLCTVDFKDFLLQNWNLIFFKNHNGTYVEDWIRKVTVSY